MLAQRETEREKEKETKREKERETSRQTESDKQTFGGTERNIRKPRRYGRPRDGVA